MNIQRFTGATAREALAKARMTFGDATLILSNRPTALGVEVMATTEEGLSGLAERSDVQPRIAPAQRAAVAVTVAATGASHQQVQDDTARLAMSTLSFQDYVRERMLRRRQTETPARGDEATPRPAPGTTMRAPSAPATPARPELIALAREPGAGARSIVDELQAMRDLIEDRFTTFAWLGQARQHPIQSNLMLKLLRAGYSPMFSRAILERMPESLTAPEAIHWMMEVIERNLKTSPPSQAIHDEGGTYALVGATGVGKTTTVAKLAGRCAQAHGAASVGMITLDTHRVGAHAQLREHGRSLGLVAHLAHDRAALQDLLGLLSGKKMVLIDTTGLSPRDPRKDDSLDLLDLPGITRLLVLNAGAQGDTLDEVVGAFKSDAVLQVILSKIDEAVKLGPALDVAIRHKLLLRGVTTGQKVPQDWDLADAGELVRQSMRASGRSAFDPKVSDLGFFFMQPEHRPSLHGRPHA